MAKNVKNKTATGKNKKKSNVILWIALVVILIPCLILGYILLQSSGSSREPVEGDRFVGDLNPAIKDSQLKEIEDALKGDSVQNVSVNLKQATLRILIDTNDDCNAEQIQAILNESYDEVVKVLPVNKYFTNQKKRLMYDLEIHVYNLIPEEGSEATQIYYLKSKNAAAEEALVENLSSAKNETVAESLLNPTVQEQEEPKE